MGFLRFMGKKKEETKEAMDLPPMPPPPSEFSGDELQSGLEDLPPIDASSDSDKHEMPAFPKIEEDAAPEAPPADIPDITADKPVEAVAPEIKPEQIKPEPAPVESEPEVEDKEPEAPFEEPEEPEPSEPKEPEFHEPIIDRHIEVQTSIPMQPLFVKVDAFQEGILTGLTIVRHELSESSEITSRLGKLEDEESKVFKDWHAKMYDIQKKLMDIDQILFEGWYK